MRAKALVLALAAAAAAASASAAPVRIESTVARPGDVVFGCMYGEQFGENAARLRISLPTDNECPADPLDGLPGALQPNPSGPGAKRVVVKLTGEAGSSPTTLVSGNLELQLSPEGVHVVRRSDNRRLTSMQRLQVSETPELGWYSFNVTWEAFPGERTFGLGENAYQEGQRTLDNRGLAIDLHHNQHNTHITIPHAISSREYGMFLNHPGWGAIDMTSPSRTVWALSMAMQVDYIFSTSATPVMGISDAALPKAESSPFADIMAAYYRAIGMPPKLPDWALGFWASKERYASQAEILETVNNYTSIHGINVSVLVIDWKTYNCVGDWDFTLNTATCWPDPADMVSKLKAMGVQEVMVSLHPWAEAGSTSYKQMREEGLCIKYPNGTFHPWGGWTLPQTCNASGEEPAKDEAPNCLYDPSNPRARQFLWSKLKASYYDKGIRQFWTDGTEPAGTSPLPYDVAFDDGKLPANASFMLWPVWHSQTIFEGQKNDGLEPGWSLARSAWAGSHRHNTILWSGDIGGTWEVLQDQLRGGLNIQLTYPYWNSDTGGFYGGNTSFPVESGFAELQARWFQFSIFCSITRLHGDRSPKEAPNTVPLQQQCDPTGAAGGPIEPWVLGNEAYLAVKAALSLRESMLPYLKEQVLLLATRGTPVMRPLFFDFSSDPRAATVEDQFMFGADYMVAPVLTPRANSTEREVYFPGTTTSNSSTAKKLVFTHYFTNQSYIGGSTAHVPVDKLSEFPLFVVRRE